MSYVLGVALLCATSARRQFTLRQCHCRYFIGSTADLTGRRSISNSTFAAVAVGQLALENVGAAGAVQRAPLKAIPVRINPSATSTKHPIALHKSIARHVSRAS